MAEAVSEALKIRGLAISPSSDRPDRPRRPRESQVAEDCYYSLPVPPPSPAQKLRNLIRRASRELTIERGRHWG